VDGYAYVTGGNESLQIFDVDPFESVSFIGSLDMPGSEAVGLHVSNGYAYIACGINGFKIVKLW
jgi:hypothetical protein